MFSKYLEKLEFNKVTENLATFSKTFIGKKYCTNLYPFNDKNKVIKALNETNENECIQTLLSEISGVKNSNIPIEHYYSSNFPEHTFRDVFMNYQKKSKFV